MNAPAQANRLRVALKLEVDALTVNQMPPGPRPKPFMLALEVEWPYRSIWQGLCPTALLFDFWVEHKGHCLWRWSQGQIFAQVETPVKIPGGNPVSFPGTWMVDPAVIQEEGLYTVHGIFIASRQEVRQPLRISLVH